MLWSILLLDPTVDVFLPGSNVTILANYSSNRNYYSRVIREGLISIHWRFINDSEIEIVVRARTLSWVGIGWRPRNLSGSCRSEFPTFLNRSRADEDYAAFLARQSSASRATVGQGGTSFKFFDGDFYIEIAS